MMDEALPAGGGEAGSAVIRGYAVDIGCVEEIFTWRENNNAL